MTPQGLRDRLTDLPGADALLKRDMIANDARLFALLQRTAPADDRYRVSGRHALVWAW